MSVGQPYSVGGTASRTGNVRGVRGSIRQGERIEAAAVHEERCGSVKQSWLARVLLFISSTASSFRAAIGWSYLRLLHLFWDHASATEPLASTTNHDLPLQTMSSSSGPDLAHLYRDYIAAITEFEVPTSPDWLSNFVHVDVIHNSSPLGIQQYRALITSNISAPRTGITVEKLIVQEDHVSARLRFTVPHTCNSYLGHSLVAAGERVHIAPDGRAGKRDDHSFDIFEHVIYQYAVDETNGKWKIKEVWSIADVEPVKKNCIE